MVSFGGSNATAVQGRVLAWSNRAQQRYNKLSKRTKIIAFALLGINGFLAVALWLWGDHIATFFRNVALSIQDMGVLGMFILSIAVALASHPPLFGFSAAMSVIGFAWGMWPGMLVASIASLMGAAIAWISIRTFFLEWMRRFGSKKNKQWEAFGHVMREKGLPLVIMIRWCPLPYAIGNGLFASIEGIKFWHYMVANLTFLPRLLIPVFIGSRLKSMGSDEPDPLHFWINLGSIAISLFFSVVTGIVIYRLTLDQMRKLDCHPGEGELAAEALEQTALLRDYSDEEEMVVRSQV